jgi:CheY-like chemotaxis protein
VIDHTVGRERRLLVIDDDASIQQSIGRQLRDAQRLQVFFETDPEKALLRIAAESWDLVLCDIKMKPLSGLEVLARITTDFPSLPVIILTGFVDDQIVESAQMLGSSDVLFKPVRKAQLLNAVARALDPTDNG